jgi:LGFP repeat
VTSPSTRLVAATSALLERRISRRSMLARVAVVGSAVTTSGFDYVLRPGSAYASVCGDGTSCSAGWTAMCCTINHGINQCPPGSFAGGWWKAEGASLCGGQARYYVDCQAECTHCECHGSAFCGEECWDCKPHCSHHGTCDQRRVCQNVFRYGQCDRDRGCSGPVLCRQISCTPPWKWADCSTTAATDDFTVSHSAPCLPEWSAIERRYTHLGSDGSVLGSIVRHEVETKHGRYQRYTHGRMYWSKSTGAHYLTGRVLHRYLEVGQTDSPLGLPTTDIAANHDHPGDGARFAHGGIFRGEHGAHALWGPIWKRWLAVDLYRGPLGFPTTDVTTVEHDKGHYAHFTNGSIYQQRGHAPRDLYGAVAAKYRELGYETSPLGFPTTNQAAVADGGEFAHFEHGSIYQGNGLPAYSLTGAIATKYAQLGYQRSPLGYPTSGLAATADPAANAGTEMLFQTGAIEVALGNPPYAVWGPIYTTWAGQGRAAGSLGFPISDVFALDSTDQRCNFEHGYAVYNQTTGQVTVTMT